MNTQGLKKLFLATLAAFSILFGGAYVIQNSNEISNDVSKIKTVLTSKNSNTSNVIDLSD